ncbi:MAG: ABC transporter ATP-binding protein [Acidimicrobiia bacterium]
MYQLRDVTKLYRQGPATIRAVDGVDLDIAAGEFVVVEGSSGSGKSSLLQLLGGLDRPTTGQLSFEGDDLAGLPDRRLADLRLRAFGFVFQQFNLIPTLTGAENIEVALAPTGTKRVERRRRAAELLDQVGLGDRGEHLPSQLSGGEQQRVAIARALANEPRVLLADEPTGNLDTRTGEQLFDLIEGLWRSHGLTVILVTHDPRIASRAPRSLHMRDGMMLSAVPEPAAVSYLTTP